MKILLKYWKDFLAYGANRFQFKYHLIIPFQYYTLVLFYIYYIGLRKYIILL